MRTFLAAVLVLSRFAVGDDYGSSLPFYPSSKY